MLQLAPVANEAARLEPLCPQSPAAAVPIQNPHLRGAPIDEGEQLPVQRVLLKAVPRQRVQPVERVPHVHGLAVQEHPDLAFGEEHQPRTSCSTKPPPSSSLTSSRLVGSLAAPIAPISMKLAADACRLASPGSRACGVSGVAAIAVKRRCHRRKLLVCSPSRLQNPVTDSPLPSKRPNTSAQACALKCRRVLVFASIVVALHHVGDVAH